MIRKYNIKYREKKKGFNKWVRNKKLISFFFLISVICLCNLFNNIDNANAVDSDENYSQYLTNNAITINDDKAMLLKTVASSGTNYRTLFENNFLFPAKLSTEALNLAGNDKSSYSVAQTYMDDLDNSQNYMSNNINENIEQKINIDNYTLEKGTNQGIEETESNVRPDVLLDNIGFSKSNPNLDYVQNIDKLDNPIWYGEGYGDGVYVYGSGMLGKTIEYEFENQVLPNITHLRIHIYSQAWTYASSVMEFAFYNGSAYSDFISIHNFGLMSHNYEYFDFNYYGNNTSNLKILFKTTASFETLENEIHSFYITAYYNCIQFNSEKTIKSIENSLYNYKGTYSFTNDTEYSLPKYWSIYASGFSKVRKETHYLHTNTLQIVRNATYSSSGANTDFNNLQKSFIEWYWITDTISAAGGSWIALTEKESSITTGTDLYFHNYGGNGNGIYYWNNVGLQFVCSASVNTWYKIRVDFDTSTDKVNITVNNVKYITNGNFRVVCTNINRLVCCHEWSNGKTRVDAVGINSYNYTSNDFTTFEQAYTYEYKLTFSAEKNIDYLNYQNYKPIFYDFFLKLDNNISYCCYNFSLFNYDLNNFVQIFNVKNKNSEYVFRFNESGYFRLNKFKVLINSTYISDFETYLVEFHLVITYIKENLNGFQYQLIRFNEYDSSMTYLGYFQLEVKINNGSINYRYLEVSNGYDNYDYGWQTYNLELHNIELETLEILGQIRFGYNTLIQEISNIRFDIILNNNEKNISILEQNRIGSFLGKNYNLQFNYSSNNMNYLNLTGINGNYSYCSFAGIRCLKGLQNTIYNRFFTIPTFWEKISVATLGVSSGSVEIENEPPAPAGAGSYWTYTSYKLVDGNIITTDVGNWSIEFRQIEVQQYTAKYYYYPKIIKESSWGSWTFKINDDWRISFNFIRDAIVGFLNLVLTFFQYMLYLGVYGVSFLLSFIGCYILSFLYNYLVYYIYVGLIWVVWWLWVLLLWLWSVIVWIWANIIIPFAEWCYYNLLPAIMEAIIIICAFLITCLLYLMTLGRIDFWETYYQVKDMLNLIVDMILEVVDVFVYNLGDILLFVIYYIALVLMLYAKYLYVKSRGYINRADSLNASFEVYIAPFMLVYNILKRVWEAVPES